MNPLPMVLEVFFIGKSMGILFRTGITSRCSIAPWLILNMVYDRNPAGAPANTIKKPFASRLQDT